MFLDAAIQPIDRREPDAHTDCCDPHGFEGGVAGGVGGAAAGTLAAPGVGTVGGAVVGAAEGATFGAAVGAAGGYIVGQTLGDLLTYMQGNQSGPSQSNGGPGSAQSTYKDVTRGGSVRNIETDVNSSAFARNLENNGFVGKPSTDGRVVVYENNEGARYVVRPNAQSTGGPTADFYKPGSGSIDIKIRLQP